MIVDDESKIRRGLSKFIDWEALGCQVMDVATNGDEAIKKIEAQVPDIVLTDIRMPLVNGFELARYIYEKKPKMESYEEAKKALAYSFYSEDQQVYIYKGDKQDVRPTTKQNDIEEWLSALENYIEDRNHEAVHEGIHALYNQLGDELVDRETIVSYSIWLYALLMQKAPSKVDWAVKKEHIQALSHMDRMDQLEAFMMKCYKEQMDVKQGSYDNYLVDLVNDYIAKHYKEHISLSSISKSLSVNHSYLSRLYKKVTSQNLTTYITKYRIDKAVELLQSTD